MAVRILYRRRGKKLMLHTRAVVGGARVCGACGSVRRGTIRGSVPAAA